MSKYDPSTKRLLEAAHRKRNGLFWQSSATNKQGSSTTLASSTRLSSSTRVKPTTSKTDSTESLRLDKLKISNSRRKVEEIPSRKESFLQSIYAPSARPSSTLRKQKSQISSVTSRNPSAQPSNRNALVLPSLSRKPSDLIPTITADLVIESSAQLPYSTRVSQSLRPSSKPSRDNSLSTLAPLPPSHSPNTSSKGLLLLKRASKILFRKTDSDVFSRPLHPQIRELLIEADRDRKPEILKYFGQRSHSLQCGLVNPHFLVIASLKSKYLNA